MMSLLELATLQGLCPRRKGSTRGGEYCSPCPSCGGNDRFILHPHAYDGKGSYFCRQCGIKGDGIQFARDFLGYTFRKALDHPPYIQNSCVKKIRVRQLNIAAEERKYVVVSGSSNCLSWYGKSPSLPIVLVESDFDAMLLWQETGDLCIPVALGSCSAKPNTEDCNSLRQASTILYALDWDSAGRKAFDYWSSFPNLKPWLSARGKSPGDDFLAGINLRDWVICGLTDT